MKICGEFLLGGGLMELSMKMNNFHNFFMFLELMKRINWESGSAFHTLSRRIIDSVFML